MEQHAIERLPETSKLYRFVSFFDLYDILVNHQLRMSKLSVFSDLNEGVGHILQFQDDDMFRGAFIDPLRIADAHESVLENSYLTCWSKEPDMIAMWSLYSPDCMSIRISTTAGKLRAALDAHNKKMSWGNYVNQPGSRKPISWGFDIGPVEYVDFLQLRDEIRRKYQEFDRQVKLRANQDPKYLESPERFKADYEKFCAEKVVKRGGLFLKDRAYAHENEVRGVLRCGVRNNMTPEEYRAADNPLKYYLFDPAKKDELQSYIFADVEGRFIESVCFDPRMPVYKRRTYESVLKGAMPELVESKAFGCVLNQESFASDFDGYPR